MKNITLNDKQVIVLESLLQQEIEFLSNEAIPEASGEDKKEFEEELKACKDLLNQIK